MAERRRWLQFIWFHSEIIVMADANSRAPATPAPANIDITVFHEENVKEILAHLTASLKSTTPSVKFLRLFLVWGIGVSSFVFVECCGHRWWRMP